MACAASLLIHTLAVWLALHTRWPAPAAEQAIELLLPPGPARIVDLTEPANRIRPDRAKAVGVEQNATTEETVAASPPRAHRVPLRGPGPASAMREPVAMRPKLPTTAVSEDLGRGLVAHIPEDYFPDYQRGGHTYMNVLKRPGVDYFVQLKRAFKMAWDPEPALRAHFAANEISRGSVKVVVGVSVGRPGTLDELFILRGSGLGRYDQEAVRAIRASAPFTAPPPSLLAADGTLRMSWTFIVYL